MWSDQFFLLCLVQGPEVLEGSSGEDEVEDETFGIIFPRSRTRRGEEFFPFPRPFRGRDEEFLGISAFFSAILRTRLLILVFRGRGRDEARNFASFLGHFEVETRPSRTSALVERGFNNNFSRGNIPYVVKNK